MTIVTFVLILTYAILIITSGSTPVAQATVPAILNFQGKLTKVSDGTNVSNATYAFRFKLYDDPTAGSLLWTEAFDQPSGSCGKLTVTNGVFNAKLGSCASLASVDFSGGAVYLSVDFAPTGTSYDGEMSPRKQILSSAFSILSNGVNGTGGVKNTISSSTALAIAKSGTDYALQVDTSAGSAVTGLKVTSAAAAGGLALSTISSGTNENLTIDAKGSGTISLGATSTGNLILGGSTGDILLGGGSGSTGCTVTNSTGAFACSAGLTATTGGVTATAGNLVATAGDLVFGATTRITNAGVGTLISGTVIGSQTFTTNNIADSGALTIKSATGANALTLDSGTTGQVNLGTGNNAKTVAIGTGTAGNTINIATDNTAADTIAIGSALDSTTIRGATITIGNAADASVSITDNNWSVTTAGAATFVGVASGSGAITGSGGATITGNIAFAGTAGNTVTAGNSTGAWTLLSGGASSWTNTAGNLTLATSTSGNIVLNSAATIELQDNTNITGVTTISSILQVGSATATTYSRLGTDTTSHGGDIDAANDLLISGGLEVNGNGFFDGNLTVTGTCTGCGGGGGALDTLTASTSDDAALLNADNTIEWDWALTSAASKAFTIAESAASTGGAGNQHLLKLQTASASTAGALEIVSNSADGGDIEFNLASAGDFEIQDAGTPFVTFTDGGLVQLASSNVSGTTTSSSMSLVANSLSDGTGLYVASSSIGTGTLVDLQAVSGSDSDGRIVLNIVASGTPDTGGTTYGAKIVNTIADSGLTNTTVALYLSATKPVSGNAYALITGTGNVGIGNSTPTALLSVGSSEQFKVSSAGTVTIATGQSYTGAGTVTLSTGANGALTLNPNGTGSLVNTLDSVGNITDAQFNRSGTLTSADSTTDVLFNRTVVTNSSGSLNSTANFVQLTSAITGTGTDTGSVLGVTQSNSSASGAAIAISNSGSGVDILGTSSTWQVTKTGAATFVGVASGSGAITGSGGATITGNIAFAGTAGNTVTAGNSTGAWTINSGGTSSWTNTSGNLTLSTATSGSIILSPFSNVGIGTTGPDRKLDVLDASNPQLRLTQSDGSVFADLQNTATANLTVTGDSLTSSSAKEYGIQISTTVNQTSSASYSGLEVNVTETAATTLNGLNRLADFRVGGSSKFAVRNDGSLTLQDASGIVTPYGGVGAFQNHLVRSEEFDNASWVKTSVTSPTADTQVAPDGSTSAESLATSGSGGDVCQWSGTAAGSDTFTFSVWVKSSSTQNFDLRVDAGATSCATANNVTGTAVTHTATTSWQRFSVTQAFSSATGNVKVRIFPGGTGGTGTVYAWGAQLDKDTKSSNYVLTTGGALTNFNKGMILESNFATASGFTYGGRHVTTLTGAIAASSSTIGQLIRVIDNATGTDDTATVRGLEVQSYSGTNINGVNTAIAGFGYTFGIHAVTTAQANEAAQPAAVFADLDNGSAPTQGNAIRAYTNDATSADLVSIYQETSSYSGNALLMNINGTFTGNFANFQTSSSTKFKVDKDGNLFATLNTGNSERLCWDGTGGTAEEIFDCTGTPGDLAENFGTSDTSISAGDVVVSSGEAVPTIKDGNFTTKAYIAKSTGAYQTSLLGVVSTQPNEVYADDLFTEAENPRPVALVGRVPVKVTLENGAIKPGDYLTSSATEPGKAMKAIRSGVVIGQALSSYDGSGQASVIVFVSTGYQSIGNTIVLDAPTVDSQALQSGNQNLASNTASTLVIQQQTSEGNPTDAPVANILQLQTGDSNRFMVSSTGSTSILSSMTCETNTTDCPSVLKVAQGNTELFNVDARGTLTTAGVIVIKDDTFAGSVATNQDGTAEITFTYNLGTGKPVVQLTAEAEIPVFAQIKEFKKDTNGNYTGFVIKTFDLIAGPVQAIVHYTVVGKQAGYITLGEITAPDIGFAGDGAGLIIENGQVVGGSDGDSGTGEVIDSGGDTATPPESDPVVNDEGDVTQ